MKVRQRIRDEYTMDDAKKIFNGIEQEVDKQTFWRLLPWVLLLAFVVMIIYLMATGDL